MTDATLIGPLDEYWPAFMIGMGRSGSNLLEKILLAHPQVNQLLPMESGASVHNDSRILDNLVRPRGLGLGYPLRWERLELGKAWRWKLRVGIKTFQIPGFRTIYRTSALTNNMAELHMVAPNGRFLRLTRDPLATLPSLRRFDKKSKDKAKMSRRAHRAYLQWLRGGAGKDVTPHQTVVRYEDLCADPPTTLQRICRFWEISDDRGLCERMAGRLPIYEPPTYDPAEALSIMWSQKEIDELRELLGYV